LRGVYPTMWSSMGKARGEREEGHYGRSSEGEGAMLAPCVQAHGGSVDGSSGRANAEDRAVPGAHVNAGHGDRICALFAPVHGRRSSRFRLVSGSSVPPDALGSIGVNGGKLRWAVTGSNRRPSRCKRWLPTQICAFLSNNPQYFANLCGFRSRSVLSGGTQ
jgi:hypothetical protein